MKLDEARREAERLVETMRPHCERVEIAGSIRRGKPEVKDIEIVAVPRFAEVPGLLSLFGDDLTVYQNLLHEWAVAMKERFLVTWIKPGTSENIPWEPKPEAKYWRGLVNLGHHRPELKLDLFMATPENFGLIYLIRTGSADFSQAVVTHAKRIGKPCAGGWLQMNGKPVPTPEEADVFRTLGLPFVAPEHRTGPEALARRAA